MVSIRQKTYPDLLPDFRNVGVIARVLIAVNAAVLAGALFAAPDLPMALQRFVQAAALVEPLLLLVITVLFVLSSMLARLPYRAGFVAVVGVVVALAAGYLSAVTSLLALPVPGLLNTIGLCALLASALLIYLRLLTKAYSPALAEARLQALQARIRPHFLFNSLNAVLSLIRNDPRRAETAIEDLAELFRTVMSDNRRLTLLADEVSLCRQYLSLEELRLGERLRVEWHVDPAAGPALVPPMLLQPLIENAIYHGIEPGIEPGVVEIRAERDGDRLRLQLSNPYHPEHQHRQGNRMALANIRERLLLHFDVEARLDTRIAGARYEIDIMIPYRAAAA